MKEFFKTLAADEVAAWAQLESMARALSTVILVVDGVVLAPAGHALFVLRRCCYSNRRVPLEMPGEVFESRHGG